MSDSSVRVISANVLGEAERTQGRAGRGPSDRSVWPSSPSSPPRFTALHSPRSWGRTTATMTKKLKVLCLHSFRTSAEILQFQMKLG